MDAERRAIALKQLQGMIDNGKAKAAGMIEKVMTEVPEDRIVKAHKISFEAVAPSTKTIDGEYVGEGSVNIVMGDEHHSLHRNAVYQVSAKAGIPVSYVDELNSNGAWGSELLAYNLNQLMHHQDPKTRFMVRSIKKQARAFLTDSYKRIDSRPLVEAATSSLQKVGALPYDGYALDTRVAIQAILPELYEPIPGEIIAFGGTLQNSDFGNGALAFNAFILRLICKNGAIGRNMLRKVHLGSTLADDFVFAQETYEANTRAMILATRDVIENSLGQPFIKGYLETVTKAHEDKLAPKEVAEILKANLTKGQVQKVLEAYNGADVEMLPAGNTTWRLSNAISWVAGQSTNLEEKLDLQKLAGDVLPKAA